MPPEITRIATSPSAPGGSPANAQATNATSGGATPARDRVDVRQVAEAIAVGQRQIIGVVDHHRAEQIGPAVARRERHHGDERQGAEPAHDVDHGEPHERIAAGLDQRVPARMQQGRAEHESEHRRIQGSPPAAEFEEPANLGQRAAAVNGAFGRAALPIDDNAEVGSPGRTRTSDPAVNSRLLYQLSYRGSRLAIRSNRNPVRYSHGARVYSRRRRGRTRSRLVRSL